MERLCTYRSGINSLQVLTTNRRQGRMFIFKYMNHLFLCIALNTLKEEGCIKH